jgi:hypothetical protein
MNERGNETLLSSKEDHAEARGPSMPSNRQAWFEYQPVQGMGTFNLFFALATEKRLFAQAPLFAFSQYPRIWAL